MNSSPLQSRSLKDRLTKVPDWFRPKNQEVAAYAQQNLRDMAMRQERNAREVAAVKAAALPKAAEIIRRYDVRAKTFLGGQSFPWASGSWERVQMNTYKRAHPMRYLIWRCTGLLAPTL